MPKNIFREYDIRGLVDKDLTPDNVRLLGGAIAVTLRREDIGTAVVGRDVRPSSNSYFDAMTDGLMKGGIDVVDIGTVPTPVLYFAAERWGIRGGVMITASHNPAEFNGFKIIRGDGSVYGKDILELHAIIEAGGLYSDGNGKMTKRDANSEYIEYLVSNIKLARPVRFAIDGGNGTSGISAPEIFRRLGCDPVELFMEPDGTFPNHHPDPTVEKNLVDLKKAVIEGGLELGIGFDGDTDRIGVLDDKGNIIRGDSLLAIYSREILADNPGSSVIFEVKCSQGLEEDILAHGGKPIMWKTGHSLIKKKMKEEGALLAGEMSGHQFFADRYFGFDDAIYAACRLLEIVSRSEVPLSEIYKSLPQYINTPEIRVDCTDESKFRIVNEIRDYFRATREVIDVDGARVRFDKGWGLIRASNTQPVLVLRFEATDKEALDEIRREFFAILGKYIDISGIIDG
ncbi:MAG: phosphomannomutase/phosphoglucomutase [Candidatus Krumholzibacteriota bacterium]|nr:phosphomannomutase/phosphoglucomutase [Candidatus Krumholzibacteriota bacterium]